MGSGGAKVECDGWGSSARRRERVAPARPRTEVRAHPSTSGPTCMHAGERRRGAASRRGRRGGGPCEGDASEGSEGKRAYAERPQGTRRLCGDVGDQGARQVDPRVWLRESTFSEEPRRSTRCRGPLVPPVQRSLVPRSLARRSRCISRKPARRSRTPKSRLALVSATRTSRRLALLPRPLCHI